MKRRSFLGTILTTLAAAKVKPELASANAKPVITLEDRAWLVKTPEVVRETLLTLPPPPDDTLTWLSSGAFYNPDRCPYCGAKLYTVARGDETSCCYQGHMDAVAAARLRREFEKEEEDE